MIAPPYLSSGSKVGIIAPSGKLSISHFDYVVQLFQSWGWETVLGQHLFKDHLFFSGTDQERLEDLQAMLDNPELDCIFCGRGGYGMTRILDQLNFDRFKENPKWIVGFSDITALHAHLHQMGFQSIHGAMPAQYEKRVTLETIQSVRNTLEGKLDTMYAKFNIHNKIGQAKGVLIGGNLALLADMIGTNSEIDTHGKIFFIEEVSEPMYRIDRMFTQLRRSGKLNQLAGLIIGDMDVNARKEAEYGQLIEELILDRVPQNNFPIGFSFPFGHVQHNLSLVCGQTVELEVGRKGSELRYLLSN